MAIQESIKIYDEVNPAKKTPEWANSSIERMRRDWRSITNLITSTKNKKLLFSEQSLEYVENSFQDADFKKNTKFIPIGVMDGILKGMIQDILKDPPKAEIKATDPSAIDLMEKDMMMLKARNKTIQKDISKYQKQIGIPEPYKLDTKNMKSNVSDFDKMGLNENDSEDTNFFQLHYQRLNSSIAFQQLVNNVMRLNRFDEDKARKFVIDILSNNVVCSQARVDKITGEIKYEYIYPENAYTIANDSNDGHNDICKGWQDSKTIPEFLSMAGNDFDWNRDWPKLLWAINYFSGLKFTGFNRNNNTYDLFGNNQLAPQAGLTGKEPSKLIDWTMAFTYKVYCGYIEWNTMEVTGNYVVNDKVPNKGEPVAYDFELKKKDQIKGYQTETYYQQQWYGSYFLATTSVSQWIFGFGKVYYQQLYGANDEYSSGTLHYFLNEGKSAVEIAEPIIEFVNFCYYKMKWIVWHSKPEEDQVVVEELIQLSKGMQRLYNQQSTNKTAPTIDSILLDLIKFQRKNFVRLRSFPQIDGKTIGQLPPLEGKRNGVDQIAAAMQNLLIWAESFISHLIGWNPMRSGGNPQSRESFKSEQATLQASYNQTGYVYTSIQFLKQRIATSTLNYVQDIIKYKDSIPYKWLMKLLGDEMTVSLDLLGDFVAHRYGIFVLDYNSDVDRQMILQAANFALQQKTITLDAWFVVCQTSDPKLGAKILAYQTYKADKKMRQRQIEDKKIEDQMAQAAFKRQLDLIKEQGKIDIEKAQLAAQAAKYGADAAASSKIEVKQLGIQAEPDKAAAKGAVQQETLHTKKDLEDQSPFPQNK